MMKILKRSIAWVVLIAAIAAVIPTLAKRIESEKNNDNVVISLYYNDLDNIVSDSKLDETLNDYLEMGVDTVTFKEEDLNYLSSCGDLTCIKFGVLRHKYDDESMNVVDAIEKNIPDVSTDSYIVMVKKPEIRKRVEKNIPLYYDESDCGIIKDVESMDIYVFYDGRIPMWNINIGYDTEEIEKVSELGFKIALMHKTNNYKKLGYLEEIRNIVNNYDVRYFNIQKSHSTSATEGADKNYNGIAGIINENNLTLVVTENVNQLSNQRCMGYDQIFASVMGEGGSHKVLRSYEPYDNTHEDESHYLFRTQQLFNSTMDRNIRFINLTQIVSETGSYEDCVEYTLKSTGLFKQQIEAEGFSVNKDTAGYDYQINRKPVYAACAVIMLMCILLMYEMVFDKRRTYLTVSALILSVAAALVTFKMPESLLALYPTVYSVVQSCFIMTMVMYFVKCFKDRLNVLMLIAGTCFTALACVFVLSSGMGAMLSGIDYYVNNLIFRGIKLSLLVPVVYTVAIYYIMFMKSPEVPVAERIKTVLNANIKVYWVIIGGIIGLAGMYYIARSGNVSQISSFETALRNTMTDIFAARPRTKEFLIGYPALVLFVYYTKKVDIKLIKWVLAVASSIFAASVTNSFCHVFTDYSVICMRVINGFVVGAAISVFAYVGNLIVLKIAKKIKSKF